jgi:hypothetical protein
MSCGRGQDAAVLDRLEQALTALEAGRHEVALDGCLDVSRRMPGEPAAARCRLVAALSLERYGVAEEAARELAALHPENGWFKAVAVEAGRRAGRSGPTEPPVDAATAWACLGSHCPAPPRRNGVPPLSRALLQVEEGELASASEALAGQAPPGSEAHDLHLALLLRQRQFERLGKALSGLTCGALNRKGEMAAQAALFLQRADFLSGQSCPTPPPGVWQADLALAVEAFRHRVGQVGSPVERNEPPGGSIPPQFWRAMTTPGLSLDQETGWLEAAAQMRPDVAALQVDAAAALLRKNRPEQAAWYLGRAEALADDPTPVKVLAVIGALLQRDFDSATALLATLSDSLPQVWMESLTSLSLGGPFHSASRK